MRRIFRKHKLEISLKEPYLIELYASIGKAARSIVFLPFKSIISAFVEEIVPVFLTLELLYYIALLQIDTFCCILRRGV